MEKAQSMDLGQKKEEGSYSKRMRNVGTYVILPFLASMAFIAFKAADNESENQHYFAEHKNDICTAQKINDSMLALQDSRFLINENLFKSAPNTKTDTFVLKTNADKALEAMLNGQSWAELINDNKQAVVYQPSLVGRYKGDTINIALQ